MINWINSWLRGIVIAVIISTIIEMIIPNGNIKKYIKTVMGVYIIFVIISPIISRITGEKINIAKYINSQTSKYEQKEIATIDTNAYIEQVYKENIKQDIMKKLGEKGYKIKKFEAEIETKEIDYGKIKKLKIGIEKENKNIEPVEISVNKQEKSNKEDIPQDELANIKTFLETTYGIEPKNIIIN